ncbi:MAG: type 1 glutamine amidotransferase [Acidocella sp.]|nr:type 1 glutamine amidotransferase [Acidocella sp.]
MKILVFQHVITEHPGSFRDVMQAGGHVMHQVQLDEGAAIPDLAGFDALLVMGGPMDVWQTEKHPWLVAEMAAIRAWVQAGRPYLGICLGAQLLAHANGGHAQLMSGPPEVGFSHVAVQADPLFKDVPPLCPCFQWHGAEVAKLPPGATLLATGAACRVQAFRLGDVAYGLQFHMEMTESSVAEWGSLPDYVASLERAKGSGALAAIKAEVALKFPPLHDAGRQIFTNFLGIAAARGGAGGGRLHASA